PLLPVLCQFWSQISIFESSPSNPMTFVPLPNARLHIAVGIPQEILAMNHSSKRSALLALTLLAVLGTNLFTMAQTQNPVPAPARSRADETLDRWNDIGNKLIAMAQDFPADKYDYKLQKDQRPFALNLLPAAAFDYVVPPTN